MPRNVSSWGSSYDVFMNMFDIYILEKHMFAFYSGARRRATGAQRRAPSGQAGGRAPARGHAYTYIYIYIFIFRYHTVPS